jgi:hypothetical protein
MADLAWELADGDLASVPVCVLGTAFKPGSNDMWRLATVVAQRNIIDGRGVLASAPWCGPDGNIGLLVWDSHRHDRHRLL